MKEAVMGVVGQHFRPEFLNRVDDSVVFHPLEKDQIQGIARIQLQILQSRLKENDICIEFDEAALGYLVESGYDPVYGARPLKRAIQRHVENPLAQALLAGEFIPGQHIDVTVADDELKFVAKLH
jgi:ATP-dependent Clp protease ATP-binding subunit ClpB